MTGDTMLFRQIHPSFLHAGFPSSQAFRPTPKDKGKLSVYDGDQISAEASWAHYTTVLKYESVGTMAVTVNECLAVGREAVPDPVPFPEHAYIDFIGLSGKECESISKKLKEIAIRRGWCYRAL